jgi:hypothetical protein
MFCVDAETDLTGPVDQEGIYHPAAVELISFLMEGSDHREFATHWVSYNYNKDYLLYAI